MKQEIGIPLHPDLNSGKEPGTRWSDLGKLNEVQGMGEMSRMVKKNDPVGGGTPHEPWEEELKQWARRQSGKSEGGEKKQKEPSQEEPNRPNWGEEFAGGAFAGFSASTALEAWKDIKERFWKWARKKGDEGLESDKKPDSDDAGEKEYPPRWKGASWAEIDEEIRAAIAQGLDPKDKRVKKLLTTKGNIVRAAEKDGYISGAYEVAREEIGQIIVENSADGSGVKKAWAKLNEIVANFNPHNWEQSRVGLYNTQKLRDEYQRVYGGMGDAYQRYLSNEIQLALMKAEKVVGLRKGDEPEMADLQRTQGMSRFGEVPGGITSLANLYARVERQEFEGKRLELERQRITQRPQENGPESTRPNQTPPRQVNNPPPTDPERSEVVRMEWPDMDWVSDEFLRKRGIRHRNFYARQMGGQLILVDMAGYLHQVFKNGDPYPRWLDQSVYTRMQSEFAQDDWDRFEKGVAPWIRMWYLNTGSYSGLVDPKSKDGLAQGLSLFYTVEAFEHDTEAKRCLSIFLQMNGQKAGGKRCINIPDAYMVGDDKAFANGMEPEFMQMMEKYHLDEAYGVAASRRWMQGVAERVAQHVGCDKATAIVMAEMATVLNGTPKMLEYRKLGLIYPFLLDDPKETVARPLLGEIFVGFRGGRSSEGGKQRFLIDYLNEGGVDYLFKTMKEITNAAMVGKAITKRARVIDGLEKAIDFIEVGEDSFATITERKKYRQQIIDAMMNEKAVKDLRPSTMEAIKSRLVWGEHLNEPSQGKYYKKPGLSIIEQIKTLGSNIKDAL